MQEQISTQEKIEKIFDIVDSGVGLAEEMASKVRQFADALAGLTHGQFFGVDFIRRDGTLRRMAAKLMYFPVDPDNERSVRQAGIAARSGNLVVLDATRTAQTGKPQVRSFNLDRVVRLRIDGQEL